MDGVTPANLRRTLAGCLSALAVVGGYVLVVPAPADGHAMAVALYGLGLAAALAAGLLALVRLTFAVQHPQMPRRTALPPRGEDEEPTFFGTIHEVLEELPAALRTPVEQGRVAVQVMTGGPAGDPYVGFARSRAGDPRLIVFRTQLERDFPDDPDALHDALAAAVREVLAHRLHLEELGVLELDAP